MTSLRYSPMAWALFSAVFAPRMKLGVQDVRMTGLPAELDEDRPLLLVANHASWWDGFVLRRLHEALRPRGRFHTVMLEREIRRRPFLRLLGGVGLIPGSPASLRSLLRALETQRGRTPHMTVLFFPQGRIWPTHRRPLGFQRGVEAVARALAPATVLPVGLHLEPGRFPAPTAFLSSGPAIPVEGEPPSWNHLEEQVQDQLDAVHAFLARHGEDADQAWPAPTASLTPTIEPTVYAS